MMLPWRDDGFRITEAARLSWMVRFAAFPLKLTSFTFVEMHIAFPQMYLPGAS
jgi:hypothetical protein